MSNLRSNPVYQGIVNTYPARHLDMLDRCEIISKIFLFSLTIRQVSLISFVDDHCDFLR